MNRLKRLLQEIHQRSLWQLLASYIVGAWLVLQIAETLLLSGLLREESDHRYVLSMDHSQSQGGGGVGGHLYRPREQEHNVLSVSWFSTYRPLIVATDDRDRP